MALAAPAQCTTCGFLLPIGGPLGQAFGVCANEYAPADGHVVSLAYGCGGHSEAAVMPEMPPAARPVLDEWTVETVTKKAPEAPEAPVEAADEEELGHS
jgi:hypothetical protein